MNAKSVIASMMHYFCNEIVAQTPSRKLRRLFYGAWLGSLGARSAIQLHCRFLNGPKIFIGNNSVINRNTILDGRWYNITIGNNVSIGPSAQIYTLEHDPHSPDFANKGGEVIVGDYVWIAVNAIVLPNVKIGRGAVVAAGAVVTRDVPEFTIVAGSPAKPVGKRSNKLTYQLDYSPWLQ